MSDETAMLAAIREFPGEDTARLVYADWLDEHAGSVACGKCFDFGGRRVIHNPRRRTKASSAIVVCPTCSGTGQVADGRRERAEFIRVQIAIANLSPPAEVRPARVEVHSAATDVVGMRSRHPRVKASPAPVRISVSYRGPGRIPTKGDVIDLAHETAPERFFAPGVLVEDVRWEPEYDGGPLFAVLDCVGGRDHFPDRTGLNALRNRERELLELRSPVADNEFIGDYWFSGNDFKMVTHGWMGPYWLYPTCAPHSSGWTCRIERGFVSHVRASGEQFVPHADRFFSVHPATSVELEYPPETVEDENQMWLDSDSRGDRFNWVDLRAAVRLTDGADLDRQFVLALLRLRWPGVEFTVLNWV